ncbi:unnamed protein product [Spirodela intermedia]|uniref:Flavin-containing monooxygenase n=1 Tax=Spirodela intermedia TaxID=51605 RepID=A0A7I8IEG1_SPIIN|nr:unnamed protein product [Spirodela intermedia]CAA6656190.1 unnamed protein product [Spirodela intermedia]
MLPQGCLSSASPPGFPRSVAVIGAGAAGLVAARELRREGHRVVVFERLGQIGGTWVYDRKTESDPLGLDSSREIVHSSLYESLRTNLPREERGGEDPRRFPGHREVLRYLEDFARDFDLCGMIRLETEVLRVERNHFGRWTVRFRQAALGRGAGYSEEVYDGVVVCNGHYTEPRIAVIPGIDSWPGKQMHSHSYRVPEPFLDQDVSEFAKEVHVASRTQVGRAPVRQPGYDNFWVHSMIARAEEDGTVIFQDGSSVRADVILHCTGYKYHFPFLETEELVTVEDNRVGPLYKHVFLPSLAPWLSFVGLPWKVVPFPLCELQSKWVAAALSGRVNLPDEDEMMEDIKASYEEIEAAGWPKRYTHNLSDCQFQYDDWLAAQCGLPPVEEWRKQMYEAVWNNKRVNPETYRDEWDDDHLVAMARVDFDGQLTLGH